MVNINNTGNPQRLTDALKNMSRKQSCGEFSLQNSLELALQTLRHVPKHTSKEVRWYVIDIPLFISSAYMYAEKINNGLLIMTHTEVLFKLTLNFTSLV